MIDDFEKGSSEKMLLYRFTVYITYFEWLNDAKIIVSNGCCIPAANSIPLRNYCAKQARNEWKENHNDERTSGCCGSRKKGR